eukprot:gb/GECG01000021.1/.p1 GENE.gb/GECG01000021.1/~~gb/GECG01000021.1/.p1  ORF type:complete len:976 (+),score=104.28 gb/GECG01000021.1/:1-2928(+)
MISPSADTKEETYKPGGKTRMSLRRVLPDVHKSQLHDLETQSTLRAVRMKCWHTCTSTPLRQQVVGTMIFTALLVLYIVAHPDSVKVEASAIRKDVQLVYTIVFFAMVTMQWLMATQLPEWRQHKLLLFSAKVLTFVTIVQITQVAGFAKTVEIEMNDELTVRRFTTEPITETIPLVMFTLFFNLWGRYKRLARVATLTLLALSFIGLTGSPHVRGKSFESPWKVLTGITNVTSVGFLSVSAIYSFVCKDRASVGEILLSIILIGIVGGSKLFSLSMYWAEPHVPSERDDDAVIHEAVMLLNTISWCFVLPLTLVWGKLCALQTASLKAEAMRRENLRHRFFRWIFHEVRVPLNNIYLVLQEFTRKILPDMSSNVSETSSTSVSENSEDKLSDFSENVNSCLEDVRSLSRTLDSVKDFDMVSSDKINLELGQFDMIRMYSKLCHAISLRHRTKSIGLDLTSRLSDSENDLCFKLRKRFDNKAKRGRQSKNSNVSSFRDVKVIGDAARIEAALSAILDNAFRFSRPSSSSCVSVDVDIAVQPNTKRIRKRSSAAKVVDAFMNSIGITHRTRSEEDRRDASDRGTDTASTEPKGLIGSQPTMEAQSSRMDSCSPPEDRLTSNLRNCPCIALLTFVISDSGGGIPEEALGTIFEPFANLSPGSRGSGLSLCIAKALIEAHNGSISVESNEGVGSTFTIEFSLPCMGTEHAEIDKLREFSNSFGDKFDNPHGKDDKRDDTGIPSLRPQENAKSEPGEASNSIQSVHHAPNRSDERCAAFETSEATGDSESTSKPFNDAPPAEIDTSFTRKGFNTNSNPQDGTPTSESKRLSAYRTFLVVDDVKTTCKLLKRGILRKMPNATVEVAYDGREAVELVRTKGISHFTHITMDKEMPDMDGYEAAQRLRQMGFSGAIIGMTGNALSVDVQRFVQKGVDFVLTKPVDLEEFASKLDEEAVSVESAVAEQLPEEEALGNNQAVNV